MNLAAIQAPGTQMVKYDVSYPANLPRMQAIRIDTYGDYVFCYTVGMPNDFEEDEAALLEYYNEQNQIASDVIAGFFK